MFVINNTYPIKIERYPDGTPRINIEFKTRPLEATITWNYEKDEEMILFFITNHLRESHQIDHINLCMPYIPHARMDRVKDGNEVFTLKHFCQFINSLNFKYVMVRDAHSNVSLALLNNVKQEMIDTKLCVLEHNLLDPKTDIVFFPDEGSCKRYANIFKTPNAFGIKERNWKTGEITSLIVAGQIPDKPFNVLIIDDISSYGGTFLHTARKLKELGADKIYLYVTHCENSIIEGELIQTGLIEKIYTTKSIYSGNHELIKII